MMFSGNGYTQKPLSWEKRKVWGNKKKKRKGCPAEGFWRIRGSQKHRQSALRQATRHVDFWTAFSPQEDNGSRKENKLQLQENLIKSQRNTNK